VKNIFIIIALVAALALSFSVVAAQTSKAAFVDSEKILGELPEAQKASRNLKRL